MKQNWIEIHLKAEERSLLLRDGDPFEQAEQALRACAGSSEIELVAVERFDLEQLIGNLCRSINDMDGGVVQDQLLHLCDRLEAAERDGDGKLDEW